MSNNSQRLSIDLRDLEYQVARGSGPGGQHRNKTESAVVLVHRPTGMTVYCDSDRSQIDRQTALKMLQFKLANEQEKAKAHSRNAERKDKIGSGERGDKIRTVRLQDGIVIDHATNRKVPAERYLRGRDKFQIRVWGWRSSSEHSVFKIFLTS